MPHKLIDYLSEDRLCAILENITSCRVAVVGDLALDGYWRADMTRAILSRETPHYPKPIVAERYAPGAGGNVAQNLTALGVARATAFSVLGDDWRGSLLQRALDACGVETETLVVDATRRTTAYIKPLLTGYESQQEDARLDFENVEPLAARLEEALIRRVSDALPELDAVIVADQFEHNGVVTDRVREALIDLARQHPRVVFVADSRTRIGLFEQMVLKPNWREAATAGGVDPEHDDAALQFATAVGLAQMTKRPVTLTLSGKGVLLATDDGVSHIPAAPATPPLDPVGAGDTFVATLATSLAAGATATEAAAMANLAAAVIVEKLNQTGTATPDEVCARYRIAAGVK